MAYDMSIAYPTAIPGRSATAVAKKPNKPLVLFAEDYEEPEGIELSFALRALACSLVFHLGLLLILAALIIPLPQLSWNQETLSSIVDRSQALEEPLFEPFSADIVVDDTGSPRNEPDQKDPAQLASASQPAESPPELNPLSIAIESDSMMGPAENLLGKGISETISATGGGITFFGTQAQGNSFAFVVDCSGSMRGHRFQRAITELKKTIGQLKNFQEFYIILYNHQAIPMFTSIRRGRISTPEPKLLSANRINKSRARRWLHSRHEGGGTVPGPALEIVLNLKPDVVFFMTDGEIPPQTRAITAHANQSESVIHTIGFQNRRSEELLRSIAQDNNGRYKFVE